MELRHIRYFVSLAKHLNFTTAAEAVHITQSTLSHQIKNLEDEIGYQLFDRSNRHIRITEHGAALLPHALRILREVDGGLRAIGAADDRAPRTLRVGTVSTVHLGLIGALATQLLVDHPEIALQVVELPGSELEQRVIDGDLDIGIGYKPCDLDGLWYEPLYRDELVLVVGSHHPLASRKRIMMGELHHQRIAVLGTQETRTALDLFLQSAKSQPTVVAEFNKIPMLLLLAATSDVGAITPRRAVEAFPQLHCIALEQPAPMIELGLVWSTTAPSASLPIVAHRLRALAKQKTRLRFARMDIRA